MKTVPTNEIILGDRQRKHLDKEKIKELANSILSKGLLHAVVCVQEEDEGYQYPPPLRLVAGERRLRAVKYIQEEGGMVYYDGVTIVKGHIPYILINSDLDEIGLREAELEENLIRVDLSWQEKVTALDELHELRLARNPKQTVADTAREVSTPEQRGSSPRQSERELHQARLVAGHLDSPEVANATSLSQAAGIVTKRMEAELTLELTRRGRDKTFRHTLILGDFSKKFHEDFPHDFSCIIADPPYGIGADKFGDAAQLSHSYDDSEGEALDFAQDIFTVGYELTLDKAHLYMFCDIELFIILRTIGRTAGWNVWRTPIIWKKTSSAAHAPQLNRGSLVV